MGKNPGSDGNPRGQRGATAAGAALVTTVGLAGAERSESATMVHASSRAAATGSLTRTALVPEGPPIAVGDAAADNAPAEASSAGGAGSAAFAASVAESAMTVVATPVRRS